jgi:hypothetical protein
MNRHSHTDRFAAVLTFVLLAGGTAAIGSALFDLDRPATARAGTSATATTAIVQLPRIEVTGRRADAMPSPEPRTLASAPAVVSLPAVTVTGRRADALAVAASAQSLRVPTSARAADCTDGAAPAPRSGQDA